MIVDSASVVVVVSRKFDIIGYGRAVRQIGSGPSAGSKSLTSTAPRRPVGPPGALPSLIHASGVQPIGQFRYTPNLVLAAEWSFRVLCIRGTLVADWSLLGTYPVLIIA